jgi:hypothetical protein
MFLMLFHDTLLLIFLLDSIFLDVPILIFILFQFEWL